MKKYFFIFLSSLSLSVNSQQQTQYKNPILAGFYPDPSICRVGSDYYLVTSSFAYYPGLPIFHSKDLVNWEQLGHAMDRPEQLHLNGAGVSRGLFAPTIRYYKGLFYIVFTLIDKGGNFVITAKNPKGPWSNPAWLKNVDGIDPSLFFDEANDRAWMIYNSIPPDNKSLYNGHRTIRMRSFDYKNLKAGDDEVLLVNGGTDISKKPVWIEAPHIYRIKDWYYLLCAEGGTGYNHSEVAFKSKNVEGPYESFNGNPILTQRQLDPKRKDPITTTGHADLVQTAEGKWSAVFLGCRPYEGDYYNTGRETFLSPVRWENEWPVITVGDEEVQYTYPAPLQEASPKTKSFFSGNFTFSTNFGSARTTLDPRFIFIRTPVEKWFRDRDKTTGVTIALRPETIAGSSNPSFIGFRQSHLKCSATTSLTFTTENENEKAGLVIFQSEHSYYYLCCSVMDKNRVVELYKSTDSENMELMTSQPLPAGKSPTHLRIVADGAKYAFYWSADQSITNSNWIALATNVDGKILSTKSAGGFVGSLFGMYATSLGRLSTALALFHSFEYVGNDDVYKH